MTKNDGGPAFPRRIENSWGHLDHAGMTLRQWYAGMALQGLLANDIGDCRPGDTSHEAFLYADAMIAADQEDED